MQANVPPIHLKDLEAKNATTLSSHCSYAVYGASDTERILDGATVLPHVTTTKSCVVGVHSASAGRTANAVENEPFSIVVSTSVVDDGQTSVRGVVIFVQSCCVGNAIESTVPSRSSTPESHAAFNTSVLTSPAGALDASCLTSTTLTNTPGHGASSLLNRPGEGGGRDSPPEANTGDRTVPHTAKHTPAQGTSPPMGMKEDMPTDILRRALATVQGSATDAASPPVLGLSRQHPMLAYDDPTTAPLLPLDPATPVLHQIAGMPREGTGQNLYLVLRVHAQGEQEAASSGVYTGPAPGSPMQTTRHGASILSPSMILGPPGPNGHVHTPGEDAPAGGKEAQPGAFSRLAAGLRSMPAFEDSCSSTEGATQDTSGVAMGGTVGSREHTPPQDGKQKIGRSRMNVEAISFSPGGALPTSVATSVLSPPGPPCAQQDVCDSGGEAYTGSSGLGATASTLQYFDLPSYSNPSPPSMGMGLGMAMGMGMQQGPGLVDLQAYLLQLQAMQVQAYMGGMFGPQSFPGAGTQESGLHVGPGPGLHLPSTQALSHRGNMLYALGSPTGAAPGLGWQGPNAGYISTPMPGRGGYNERLLRETQHMPLRGHPEAEGGTAGQDEGDWQATSSPHQPSRDFGYGRQHGAGAGRSSFPRHASTFISTGLGGGPLQVVPEADMRQQAQKHVWHLQQSLEALQSLIPEHDYEPLSSLVCVPPSASPSGRYEPKPVAIVRGKTLFTTSIRHIDYGSEPVRGLPDVLADIGTITFDKAQRAAQRASASKDTARVAYVEAGAVPVLVELARLLQCRDRTTDTALEFTIQALCNIAYHPTARDVMTRPDSGLLEVICDTMRWNTNLNIALKCARTVDALVWENTVAQQRAAYLGICELAVECIQRHSIDAHAVLNLARMLSAIARTVETLKAVQVAGLEEACEAVKGQQYSEGWEKLVGEHTAAEQARYQRPSPSRLLRQSGGTTQAGARAAAGLHLLLDKANRADSRML